MQTLITIDYLLLLLLIILIKIFVQKLQILKKFVEKLLLTDVIYF